MLLSQKRNSKIDVDSDGDNLGVDQGDVDPGIAKEGPTAIDFPPLVLHLVVQVDFLG